MVVRFHVSETANFSSYYLLYNRDIILPLDDILRPHRIYYGNEHHEIALQEMHRTFTLIRSNMKKAKRKAMDESLAKTKDVKFKVGDLVYYRNHYRRGKLDVRWQPYYVVVEKTGPVSYEIKAQCSVTKVHTEHLRVASIEEWEIPTTARPLQKSVLAALVDSSDSDSKSVAERADLPMRWCRHQRENSDDESDVPLMEHFDRLYRDKHGRQGWLLFHLQEHFLRGRIATTFACRRSRV